MWQQHQKKGMQLFLSGDIDSAVASWKDAVSLSGESSAEPTPELADLYYCLGKSLSDLRQDDESIKVLRSAVDMLTVLGLDERRKVAQYQLAEVLNRNGVHEEATQQFKMALSLPIQAGIESIPLKTALDELRRVNLCKELKGGVLSNLCHRTGIDADGDNSDLADLLIAYYIDERRGVKRQLEDKFFIESYVDFETERVLQRLNTLSNHHGLLTLVDQRMDTADGETMVITMRRSDGDIIYRASQSVVGLVDEYNSQLELLADKARFFSLNADQCFVAYFMDVRLQNELNDARVLDFDVVFAHEGENQL